MAAVSDPTDPVLVRRAQIARLASLGRRAGYGLFALAMALFIVGFATTFHSAIATAIIVSLVVGSAALAPAIVAGYAVKAAERDDAGRHPPESGRA